MTRAQGRPAMDAPVGYVVSSLSIVILIKLET